MTHIVVPEHHVILCTCTLGARSSGAFVEVISALGSVNWLLEVSAYLGAIEYAHTQQLLQHLLSQLELHEYALQVPRYHTAPVLGRVLQSVRNNAFLQHCRACYDAHNRRTTMAVQRPPSSLANSISPLSLDGALFCISEGSSMPGTPAIMTGSSSPVSTTGPVPITLTGRGQSMGVAALTEAITEAGDDAEFAAVLKKLSRFQAVPQDTVPAGAKDTSPATVSTTAGIAERLVSTASPNAPTSAGTESEQSSAPPLKVGGFNFASLSRAAKAPSTATSTAVPANPVIGAPSALDAFDVPAVRPAQRTTTSPVPSSGGFNFATATRPSRPQASASDLPATGTADPTSAVPSALDAFEAPPVRPTTRLVNPSAQRGGTSDRRSRGGAPLDLLGDGTDLFPPPVRPSRPSTTTASATSSGTQSVDNAAAVGSRDRGRGGASLDLLGDATDMFPPPVRPSRPAATTATGTGAPATTAASVEGSAAAGSRDTSRGGASLDLLGDAADMFPPPVRPSRPSTTTASATSTGTQSVDSTEAEGSADRSRGGASLNLLDDATDMFPPPVRPSRPATTTVSPTEAATSVNGAAAAGSRDRGRGGASLDLLGDATDLFPPPVRPSRPARTTATTTAPATGTHSGDSTVAAGNRDRGTGGASLDLLGDATDMFPPPVRPSRPAAATAAATATAAGTDSNSAPPDNEGTKE
jgi:hypothetical protein